MSAPQAETGWVERSRVISKRGRVPGLPLKRSVEWPEWFAARVHVVDAGHASPCWLWLYSKRAGYGRTQVLYRGVLHRSSHRLSFHVHRGPIPAGLHIDHLCRNRACCNPDHLEAVSQHENNRRSLPAIIAAGLRARKAFCQHGHAMIGRNVLVSRSGDRRCRKCAYIYNARAKRLRQLRKGA